MIYIALDTSILHSEGLSSRNMRLLTRLALAGELAIFIPELVAREFVSKYVAEAQEKLGAAHLALTDLRRKLGRGEGASDEIAELLSQTTRIRGGLAEMLKHDFESWVRASKVKLLKFNPRDIDTVLDGYFDGTGPYKTVKSREDIPDAIIACCISALTRMRSPLHVAVTDKRLNQHVSTIEGVRAYKGLRDFLTTAEVSRIVAVLDQKEGIAAFKSYLLSGPFGDRLRDLFVQYADQFDDVYLEGEDISNPDALNFPFAFGLSIDYALSNELQSVNCVEATNTGPGQFVVEVELRTVVRVNFCGSYGELIALPNARQNEIEEGSMDGDGICDLSEVREVLLRGQLSMEFDRELDVTKLSEKIMQADFDLRKSGVKFDLIVRTGEIQP